MTRTLVAALLTLGDPGRLTGGYLFHRRIAELAPRFAARVEFVSFPERPFPLATLDAPRILRRAQRTGAQALVVDSICAALLGPWLRVRQPALPLLGMLHQPPGGIDDGPPRSIFQAYLDRLAYARARMLMVASESLFDELARAGVTRDRMRVVPPGRDVAAIAGPPAGDLRRGRRAAFLFVGNWMERKGVLSLLDALSRLPPDAVTLHLAGDPDMEPVYAARIRARLTEPDLFDRVVVHGPQPVGRVAALYAAADVFVLPSLKEPYGTVLGEAMAYGLPVVGWRAGNLPYLATTEREGLIVEPGDIAGLARAMQRLADDDRLRQRMGAAARLRADQRCTWEQSAELFFSTIRDVIAGG